MLRKRVHLYTTARWLEPLGVKLDTERRPIYIYICSIGSVYVYDIYIAPTIMQVRAASVTIEAGPQYSQDLQGQEGRQASGAVLILGEAISIFLRISSACIIEVGGRDLRKTQQYPAGLGMQV